MAEPMPNGDTDERVSLRQDPEDRGPAVVVSSREARVSPPQTMSMSLDIRRTSRGASCGLIDTPAPHERPMAFGARPLAPEPPQAQVSKAQTVDMRRGGAIRTGQVRRLVELPDHLFAKRRSGPRHG